MGTDGEQVGRAAVGDVAVSGNSVVHVGETLSKFDSDLRGADGVLGDENVEHSRSTEHRRVGGAAVPGVAIHQVVIGRSAAVGRGVELRSFAVLSGSKYLVADAAVREFLFEAALLESAVDPEEVGSGVGLGEALEDLGYVVVDQGNVEGSCDELGAELLWRHFLREIGKAVDPRGPLHAAVEASAVHLQPAVMALLLHVDDEGTQALRFSGDDGEVVVLEVADVPCLS